MALATCFVGALPGLAWPAAGRTEAGATARITGVSPLVQLAPGATMCVCGDFPSAEAAASLRIDGLPLPLVETVGPVESGRVTVRLPAGIAPGAHTVTGAPEAGYDAADREEVHLVAVHEEVSRPLLFGSSRRIRLTLTGTKEPVELRLENLDPDVVRLQGGPVLTLTTSGGRRNRAEAKAHFLVPAARASLRVAIAAPPCACAENGEESPRPVSRSEVAELAGALRASVEDSEAWLRSSASEIRALAVRGDLSALESRLLIDALARRLRAATADPELAALRAWIEDRLDEELERWPTPPDSLREHPPWRERRLLPAAFPVPPARSGAREAVPEAEAEGLLDRLFALLATLRDVSRDLVVDLCVRSRPARAEVWVQPKRYEPGRRTELTNTEFSNLTRGVYVGRAQRAGTAPADFEVDLVREAGIYVECDFADGLCDQQKRPEGFSCREAER